jgi:hypothetical protein
MHGRNIEFGNSVLACFIYPLVVHLLVSCLECAGRNDLVASDIAGVGLSCVESSPMKKAVMSILRALSAVLDKITLITFWIMVFFPLFLVLVYVALVILNYWMWSNLRNGGFG